MWDNVTPLNNGYLLVHKILLWLGYPMVKKCRRYLYSFWRNSGTWQTDRQTPGDSIYRAYAYASRGKNCWQKFEGSTGSCKLNTRGMKTWHFSTEISLYFENGTRYGHSYNGRRIETCTRSIEWCYFQWPSITSNLDFKVTIFWTSNSTWYSLAIVTVAD